MQESYVCTPLCPFEAYRFNCMDPNVLSSDVITPADDRDVHATMLIVLQLRVSRRMHICSYVWVHDENIEV